MCPVQPIRSHNSILFDWPIWQTTYKNIILKHETKMWVFFFWDHINNNFSTIFHSIQIIFIKIQNKSIHYAC
jgi:hypothetical protein